MRNAEYASRLTAASNSECGIRNSELNGFC